MSNAIANAANLFSNRTVKILPLFILAIFTQVKAQTVTYSFAGATETTSPIGYQQAGIGTYYKGTSGGSISDGSTTCNGYTPSKPTSSSLFVFLPTISNISKITVNGTGTGSNRTFSKLETASTINGTYTQDVSATGTGTISGTTCGSIVITPSANINSGTYIKITFSGNLNITSIDFLNNATAPVMTTTTAVANNCTTANLAGSVDNDGGFSEVTRGFVYSSTNTDPTLSDVVVTDAGKGTGSFSASLTGLTPGTTYYVKAYGTNSKGTGYGAVKSFTTATPSSPILSATNVATNITSFGALTGANVTADGCSDVTARGVVWSTSSNPTLPSANSTVDGSGTGSYTSQITGLAAATKYYVRAYATNSTGTAYGDEISFTTADPQPSLFASPVNLNFPKTEIGKSYSLTYTLTGSTLNGSPITLTAPAGFTVTPSTINYQGSSFTQTVTVTFTPTSLVAYSGSISQTGGGATGLYIVNPSVTGSAQLPIPAVTSNVGNDFWLGFGYHTSMSNSNPSSSSAANLSLYISSADKDATVIVEIPGMGGAFTPIEVVVPAGTVQEVSGFPRAGGKNTANELDSRLYFTGITNRAIHVYSKDGTPVSVWMYTYSNDNSAAGSMIFPTNTWNTSYAVQAYGNNTNSGVPNSFFFVIAEEDGTEVEITPTADILSDASSNIFAVTDGSPAPIVAYPANVPFTITLNRGQVFNAMGSFTGSIGLDLTGTTIKTTNCKKIAVFGGNGRCLVDVGDGITPPKFGNTGSDNLVQQMFPKVAWGTKYYTVPTKHMEYNRFRISVDDPNTKVWVNDPTHTNPLTGLTNGYYQYDSNQPLVIESDKPVSVTQFISAQGYATGKTSLGAPSDYGMNGIGDPEMIILSPSQQSINKVTVYTPAFKNGKSPAAAYINVVIPKSGVNSFKLDLTTNPQQLVDTGSSSYTGIPLDPAPALIPIAEAFKPYEKDANYYWAKFRVDFPNAHTLTSDVPFNAIAYGTNDGESYGFNAGTQVNDLSTPLILYNPYGDSLNSLNSSKPLTTCKGTEVTFAATLPFPNVQGKEIVFSYGNNPNISPNINDTIKNPVLENTFVFNEQTFYVYKLATKHIYNATGDYQVQVTYFNPQPTNSCGGEGGSDKTISFPVKVINGVNPAFDIEYNTCISSVVKITDKSDGLGYDLVKWLWSYNNGATPLPENQAEVQNPTFTNPANNTADNVTLRAVNSIGCFNDLKKQLPIQTKPVIVFSELPTGLCNTASAAFELTNYATPAGGTFSGNGVELRSGKYWFNPANAAVSTSQANVITYNYTGGNSCAADPKTQNISITLSVTPTITAVQPKCVDANSVQLAATPTGGTWSGNGVSGSSFTPSVAGVGSHVITYTLGTACTTPATTTIVVNPLPTVNAGEDFELQQNQLSTLQGSGSQGTYLWSPALYLNDETLLTPSIRPAERGEYSYTLTITSAEGCTNSDAVTVTVKGKCIDPMKGFTPNNDGYNDKWKVFASEGCYQKVTVDVYNRWGSLVYHKDKYDNSWIGDYEGKKLPDGTYYYIIKAQLPGGRVENYTGNVTIIR